MNLIKMILKMIFGNDKGNPPAILTRRPPKKHRELYSYMGKILIGGIRPLYALTSMRSRPTLILGTTGCGKTEYMLSSACQDALRGCPLIFIDGKADRKTWNKFYYYCSIKAKRPFYALFPLSELDHLSQSWNPLHSTLLSLDTVVDSFFNTYTRELRLRDAGTAFYHDFQRNIFTLLCRAFYESGWGFNFNDISILLKRPDVFAQLRQYLSPKGLIPYNEIINKWSKNVEKFTESMTGFTNYLDLFKHWTLNSYNPEIQFDRLLSTNAVIYVGLPVNTQKTTMSAIGNILINQLKALSNHMQTTETENRRPIACYIDEAGSFVDESMADWICKVRSSGFMLTLGIQTLADLEQVSPTFAKRIQVNTPNILLFNPQSRETANWFSDMTGKQQKIDQTITTDSERPETVRATERVIEEPKIHPDFINQLRVGQCIYRPAERVNTLPYMAASILPDCPPPPNYQWHGLHRNKKPETKGLFFHIRFKNIPNKPD